MNNQYREFQKLKKGEIKKQMLKENVIKES